MLEPLQASRPLPLFPEERQRLLEAARDWLGRFLELAKEEREKLLGQALKPELLVQEAVLLYPSENPLPGWDWPAGTPISSLEETLFDPEIIEKITYIAEKLLDDADKTFFRELALLAVDRLDLLISLLQTERDRLL